MLVDRRVACGCVLYQVSRQPIKRVVRVVESPCTGVATGIRRLSDKQSICSTWAAGVGQGQLVLGGRSARRSALNDHNAARVVVTGVLPVPTGIVLSRWLAVGIEVEQDATTRGRWIASDRIKAVPGAASSGLSNRCRR